MIRKAATDAISWMYTRVTRILGLGLLATACGGAAGGDGAEAGYEAPAWCAELEVSEENCFDGDNLGSECPRFPDPDWAVPSSALSPIDEQWVRADG